jgi:hypothetical protein
MQILETKPYSSPLSTLDVPSSPRPPWWQSVPGQMALSAGAFLLVLFARRPETFLNPQLWAEDGFIFLVQADEFGARALTFSWAGYHHFLLRLIAVVSSPLNAQLVPAAYVGISLLVLLAVVVALFSPRLDLPARSRSYSSRTPAKPSAISPTFSGCVGWVSCGCCSRETPAHCDNTSPTG